MVSLRSVLTAAVAMSIPSGTVGLSRTKTEINSRNLVDASFVSRPVGESGSGVGMCDRGERDRATATGCVSPSVRVGGVRRWPCQFFRAGSRVGTVRNLVLVWAASYTGGRHMGAGHGGTDWTRRWKSVKNVAERQSRFRRWTLEPRSRCVGRIKFS